MKAAPPQCWWLLPQGAACQTGRQQGQVSQDIKVNIAKHTIILNVAKHTNIKPA
jgi:hypothetical protein